MLATKPHESQLVKVLCVLHLDARGNAAVTKFISPGLKAMVAKARTA